MSRWSLKSFLFPILYVLLPLASAFNREFCLQTAQDSISNQSLSSTSFYFFRDTPSSTPYNGPSNMTLTLAGCNALCGPKQTWYTDIAPCLTVWLFPILLLFANVELSPLDKRRFFALIHLLGDPIDSIWSLLYKLNAWDRCCTLAEKECPDLCPSCQRVVAAVFAGFEEVQGPRITSESEFKTLLLKDRDTLARNFLEWRHAAIHLADGRTDELSRTALAFLLYVFQLVSAFVPAIGGVPSSPSGGRIATSVLLSWLVPVIFLSNAVGNLTSCRTACDVMTSLTTNTTFPLLAKMSATDYSEAIYTYRPWKLRCLRSSEKHHGRHTLFISLLATAPVLLGFFSGVLIL